MLNEPSSDALIKQQLKFFRTKRSGCLFAAAAACEPKKYGWVHRILPAERSAIDSELAAAIADPATAMVSLLFPSIASTQALISFVAILKQTNSIMLEQCEEFLGTLCFGFRAKVGELRSYVTGFGDFPFLPATRRTPCVELTIRVKPRPTYEFVFKEAPPQIIHLADLDMLGIDRTRLERLWQGSFTQTQKILGAPPDLRSAARTTYCIPTELLDIA